MGFEVDDWAANLTYRSAGTEGGQKKACLKYLASNPSAMELHSKRPELNGHYHYSCHNLEEVHMWYGTV